MACYSIATAARLWQAGRSLLLRGCGHVSPFTAHAWLVCLRCPQPIGGGNITIITKTLLDICHSTDVC